MLSTESAAAFVCVWPPPCVCFSELFADRNECFGLKTGPVVAGVPFKNHHIKAALNIRGLCSGPQVHRAGTEQEATAERQLDGNSFSALLRLHLKCNLQMRHKINLCDWKSSLLLSASLGLVTTMPLKFNRCRAKPSKLQTLLCC